jgi:hypothetical protein
MGLGLRESLEKRSQHPCLSSAFSASPAAPFRKQCVISKIVCKHRSGAICRMSPFSFCRSVDLCRLPTRHPSFFDVHLWAVYFPAWLLQAENKSDPPTGTGRETGEPMVKPQQTRKPREEKVPREGDAFRKWARRETDRAVQSLTLLVMLCQLSLPLLLAAGLLFLCLLLARSCRIRDRRCCNKSQYLQKERP